MKPLMLLIGVFFAALPAAAQSPAPKVYTNADLGKVVRTRTVTPAELRGLVARQFVYVPARPAVTVFSTRSDPGDGPFGKFAPPIPDRRLDGSLWTDPPWEMRAYVGYGHRGYGAPGPRMGPPSEHPRSPRGR